MYTDTHTTTQTHILIDTYMYNKEERKKIDQKLTDLAIWSKIISSISISIIVTKMGFS